MTKLRPLVMSINLNALEHLGINLYSNIPAVLSEIVANAWDADAKNVSVTIDKASETITIDDDGTGMDRDGVIDRFLTVGFKRREKLGEKTATGRNPMGRKGLGKLSIFSIAQTAEVYTADGGTKTAFRMDREVIRKAIAGKSLTFYEPEELSAWPKELKKGTRIVLSGISKSLSGITVGGLKRRVARRFSVIGPQFDFTVNVNGMPIGPDDRGYHNAIQYLWTYGNQSEVAKLCKNLGRPAEARLPKIKTELKEAGIDLTGWIRHRVEPSPVKGRRRRQPEPSGSVHARQDGAGGHPRRFRAERDLRGLPNRRTSLGRT